MSNIHVFLLQGGDITRSKLFNCLNLFWGVFGGHFPGVLEAFLWYFGKFLGGKIIYFELYPHPEGEKHVYVTSTLDIYI